MCERNYMSGSIPVEAPTPYRPEDASPCISSLSSHLWRPNNYPQEEPLSFVGQWGEYLLGRHQFTFWVPRGEEYVPGESLHRGRSTSSYFGCPGARLTLMTIFLLAQEEMPDLPIDEEPVENCQDFCVGFCGLLGKYIRSRVCPLRSDGQRNSCFYFLRQLLTTLDAGLGGAS